MASFYKLPRGTRANFTTLAAANGLIPYQNYWITDENRMVMATSVSASLNLPRLGNTNSWTGTQTFAGNLDFSGSAYGFGWPTENISWGGYQGITYVYMDDAFQIWNWTGGSYPWFEVSHSNLLYQNADTGVDNFKVDYTTGNATVRGTLTLANEAYGSGWNGKLEAPTKDAVYDQVETLKTGSISFVIDGGGQAIAAGQTVDLPDFPFAATVTGWTITSDASTTSVVTVSKATYANFPTMTAISGTEKPTLTAAQKNQDLTLTTWTTALAQGDTLRASVDSNNNATRLTVTVRFTRT